MSFPRYPSYKDSGVEWLGEVPGHWNVDRLKRSTIIAKNGIWGDEPQQDENDIPCVRVADFDRQALRVELTEPTIRNVVEKDRVGRVLSRGDLLLEKSGGGEGQPVGCVVLYDDPRPAVCSNFVARVQTAPGMNSSFWRYVHAAAYAVRLNTRSIKQTSGIQNLDASQYFDERCVFPSLPEQTQIAAFLDRETAKIDELVAEQRRLMELLKEKRQAVISLAVTKGLNPNAPMKPSGIEWLGDVPEHWVVAKTVRYFKVAMGQTILREDLIDDGEWPVFSATDGDHYFGRVNEPQVRLAVGDIVIPARGNSIGAVKLVKEPSTTTQTTIYCKNITSGKLDPSFVFHFLKGCKDNLFYFTQTAIPQITVDEVGSNPILIPPLPEQTQIAAFLDRETAKLDTLTAEAQRAIDLLQERRTALISAAVTGQIDVRQLTEEQTA